MRLSIVRALPIERRRLGREGLSGRGAFARRIGRGNRPLFDRPHRLSGRAIEDERERLFRQLHDRAGFACPPTVMSARMGAAGRS